MQDYPSHDQINDLPKAVTIRHVPSILYIVLASCIQTSPSALKCDREYVCMYVCVCFWFESLFFWVNLYFCIWSFFSLFLFIIINNIVVILVDLSLFSHRHTQTHTLTFSLCFPLLELGVADHRPVSNIRSRRQCGLF